MNTPDLLFWITVGIGVGAFILIVVNALITSLIDVYISTGGKGEGVDGCSCTDWKDGVCVDEHFQNPPCDCETGGKRRQSRICDPFGCDIEETCRKDSAGCFAC